MRISQNQIYKTSPDTLLAGVAANYSNSQIMGEIREFLNVKTVNEIKRIKKDYVELAYEVRTKKASFSSPAPLSLCFCSPTPPISKLGAGARLLPIKGKDRGGKERQKKREVGGGRARSSQAKARGVMG